MPRRMNSATAFKDGRETKADLSLKEKRNSKSSGEDEAGARDG